MGANMSEEESQTEALCSTETIASYFRMIDFYEAEIKERQSKIQQLMNMLQLEAGRTFIYKGQCYQVCQRKKEGTFFFKKPDQPPKVWLGRKAREARRRCSTPGLAVPEKAVQLDVELRESGACILSETEAEALPEGATAAALATE
jgi:hypothetical protein